jgi:hypothetical protein
MSVQHLSPPRARPADSASYPAESGAWLISGGHQRQDWLVDAILMGSARAPRVVGRPAEAAGLVRILGRLAEVAGVVRILGRLAGVARAVRSGPSTPRRNSAGAGKARVLS